jgi:hypothetical protein
LPISSSINTLYYATIKAVLSMSSAPGNSRNGVLCDQLLGYATVLTIELCFLCGLCRGYIMRFQPLVREDICVEVGSNTSTVTLRVVGGDEKGSLRSDTVKYGREFQGTRTQDGKDQQHIQKTDPSSRQRGRPTKTRP